MAKQVADQGAEYPETLMRRGSTQPMPAVASRQTPTGPTKKGAQRPRPSYHPTGIKLADRALDLADTLTNGRADWIQRIVSYGFIGGFAAIINLIVITIVMNISMPGVVHDVQYGIAFVIATEVSLMANFIPNDYFTFSHLPGHSRSWLMRCLRFHLTGIGGVIVTFAVSFTLHKGFGLNTTIAQAIALIIAVFFNFTFHHIFTYRRESAAA